MNTKKEQDQKHTPGPWADGDDCAILGGDDPAHQIIVAEVYTRADRALVKSAPDLLDALKRIKKALDINPKAAEDALRDDPQAWDALRAAIARAEGKEAA